MIRYWRHAEFEVLVKHDDGDEQPAARNMGLWISSNVEMLLEVHISKLTSVTSINRMAKKGGI